MYNYYTCLNMNDISKYPFKRLLVYLDERGRQTNEELDWAGYLLSMNQANSIVKLIGIYNNVFTILASFILRTKKLPDNWYQTERLGIGNAYLFDELCQCCNDNILRLFKECKNPTKEQCITFLVNLRNGGDNVVKIQNEIINNIHDELNDIYYFTSVRNKYYFYKKNLESSYLYYSERGSDFNYFRHNSKMLASHGRIFDIADNNFAKKLNIDFERLKQEYAEELKKWKITAKEKRKNRQEQSIRNYEALYTGDYEEEPENNKQNNKEVSKISNIQSIFIALCVLPIFLGILFLVSSLGLMGIIVVVGFIGLIPKIFLTGKI